jgi:hypothetical protein
MYAGHFDFTVPLLWTVDSLLSEAECAVLLSAHADAEWLPATINSAAGRVVETRVRDSRTAIVRDPELAALLYARALPHLPARMRDQMGGRPRQVRPFGLYQPLRIYRYEIGEHFGLHHDQSYQDPGGRRSLLTFMVYLNEGFSGGETSFPEQGQVITPRTGMALLFQHMLLHAGERVTSGTKYALRTDVLFEPC